jgi:hypothetical protein
VDSPLEANPRLLRELTAKQAPLMEFHEVPRSLEQVYLKVMAEARAPREGAAHA